MILLLLLTNLERYSDSNEKNPTARKEFCLFLTLISFIRFTTKKLSVKRHTPLQHENQENVYNLLY